MDTYRELFDFVQVPALAVEIAFGSFPLPISNERPFDTYGFLPALLPLWCGETPSYTGYWKHWFGERSLTIVAVTVENQRRTREVARNFEQIAREVVLTAAERAESLTPEIEAFGNRAAISAVELEEIAQIQQEWGNEPEGLLPLPQFSSAAPLACFPEGGPYSGDFPYDAMPLNEQVVRNICTPETSRELRQRIAALPYAPPWFTTTEQAPVFEHLLGQKDYLGAWMSLNSNGWRFLEAKKALRQLAQESNVPGLDLLAKAWAAVPHEKNGTSPESASY